MSVAQIWFLIGVTLINFSTYMDVREIIWSILWLDKKGKYAKFKEYRTKLKYEQTTFRRISMRYILGILSKNQDKFLFWWRFKRFFVIIEALFTILYVVVAFFGKYGALENVREIIFLVQSIAFFLFLRIQFGMNDRLTKYDRMRVGKR